jgi:hypothetical protein
MGERAIRSFSKSRRVNGCHENERVCERMIDGSSDVDGGVEQHTTHRAQYLRSTQRNSKMKF